MLDFKKLTKQNTQATADYRRLSVFPLNTAIRQRKLARNKIIASRIAVRSISDNRLK
jgi:hypothetical protein